VGMKILHNHYVVIFVCVGIEILYTYKKNVSITSFLVDCFFRKMYSKSTYFISL
jgi:hypothetical protein